MIIFECLVPGPRRVIVRVRARRRAAHIWRAIIACPKGVAVKRLDSLYRVGPLTASLKIKMSRAPAPTFFCTTNLGVALAEGRSVV